MRKIPAALICILLILTFSVCDISSFSISGKISPDDEHGNSFSPGDFIIGIESLTLSVRELGSIPGRNPELRAVIMPPFATEKQLLWTSSNHSAAVVDGNNGTITVRTEIVTGDPISTIIRVESISDPSKYDTCILTIYPDYPKVREWIFSTADAPAGGWPVSANNNVDVDYDLGGGTILFATGGGTDYQHSGAGVHVIDPEYPYEYGPTPNGGPLSSSSTAHTHNAGTLGGFLYPNKTTLFSGHYRIGGTSQRIMRIPALFAPFTIIVNYRTNSSGEARNIDIRIGDTEGWRIEGEGSTGSGTGVNAAGAVTVWYSYDPSDADKPEAGADTFVPSVYIEANAGMQIYAVYVFEGVFEETSNGLIPKP